MSPKTDGWLPELAVTMLIAALGAGVFWLIGFPAALLTGSASAVSLGSLLGVATRIPDPLREGCLLVLGVGIGATVTPDVLNAALLWPLSLFALCLVLLLSIFCVRLVLEHWFRFDRQASLLAATPGHLSYVLGLSSTLTIDVSRITLVQSIRVLLLTLVVPLVIQLWGVVGTSSLAIETQIMPFLSLAAVLAVSFALGTFLRRVNVPAPMLLGGIGVSALGHGLDLTPGSVPPEVNLVALLTMGALIGTRFRGFDGADLRSTLLAGLTSTAITCAMAIVGALIVADLIDVPPAAVLLAFAPGAVEVIAALAIQTGLEPAYVAAHHVFRLLFLTLLVPILLVRAR